MASRVLHVTDAATDRLRQGIAAIQEEQGVSPAFPPQVEEAAEQTVAALPDLDLTDVPFVTIDPAGSMDLDQALHLSRDGEGYLVRYAIADVAASVPPGGPVDLEAHRRGETLYGADATVPLHPRPLSEGSASLLPDQERPALVWTIGLDAAGALGEARVERARVRSRRRWSYVEAQRAIDDGTADEVLVLLAEVGRLRQQQEIDRGGVSLPMPEQEVEVDGDSWSLVLRSPAPVEGWNAQISLLTGIAAARMMIAGGIGVLRTLPPSTEEGVARLRRRARALGVPWPADLDYPAFVRSLDPSKPRHAAMVVACTTLFRGAAYAAFDGTPPAQDQHAALATSYAHVTAPLRRLVDRFGLEVCVALCAGTPVPDWVRAALPDLPDTMRESGRRARTYENAVVDLVEAALLEGQVGASFEGVVLEADGKKPTEGSVQIADPAVEATVTSDHPLPVGDAVTVTLTTADPATRKVAFRL